MFTGRVSGVAVSPTEKPPSRTSRIVSRSSLVIAHLPVAEGLAYYCERKVATRCALTAARRCLSIGDRHLQLSERSVQRNDKESWPETIAIAVLVCLGATVALGRRLFQLVDQGGVEAISWHNIVANESYLLIYPILLLVGVYSIFRNRNN